MAHHPSSLVTDRREAERRSADLEAALELEQEQREDEDRRQLERRDLGARPTDLTADNVIIDLRDGRATVEVLPDVEVVWARRWFLLAILGALNVLDLISTKLVIEAGGVEANPIMAPIIHHPFAPVLVKTAGFVVVALVLRACPSRSVIVDRALAAVTALYTVIVSWNLINLLLHT